MEHRYFIYVYFKGGNIGPHQVELIPNQPEDGFETEEEAESVLNELIENRKEHYFDRAWYHFTILKTYRSKSATDKEWLAQKEREKNGV